MPFRESNEHPLDTINTGAIDKRELKQSIYYLLIGKEPNNYEYYYKYALTLNDNYNQKIQYLLMAIDTKKEQTNLPPPLEVYLELFETD